LDVGIISCGTIHIRELHNLKLQAFLEQPEKVTDVAHSLVQRFNEMGVGFVDEQGR